MQGLLRRADRPFTFQERGYRLALALVALQLTFRRVGSGRRLQPTFPSPDSGLPRSSLANLSVTLSLSSGSIWLPRVDQDCACISAMLT